MLSMCTGLSASFIPNITFRIKANEILHVAEEVKQALTNSSLAQSNAADSISNANGDIDKVNSLLDEVTNFDCGSRKLYTKHVIPLDTNIFRSETRHTMLRSKLKRLGHRSTA